MTKLWTSLYRKGGGFLFHGIADLAHFRHVFKRNFGENGTKVRHLWEIKNNLL